MKIHISQKLLGFFAAAGIAAAMSMTAFAEGGLEMSTAYPGVTAKPGDTLNFDLDFDNNSGSGVNLALTQSGTPDGWDGYFEGSGNEISNAFAKSGENDKLVTYSLTVPDSAANGSYNITLNANGGAASSTITLTVNINEDVTSGSKIATDPETQSGSSSETFKFNAKVTNSMSEKQSFNFTAENPDGWKTSFTPDGQTSASSSMDVAAHGNSTMTITVTPPSDAAAGDYKIPITAASGSETLSGELDVTITGNYKLDLTTPTQTLNFNATANHKKSVTVDLVNSGNIDLTNVNLTASAPTDWTVEFSESTIDSIPAGQTKEVTMEVTPSKDAISGDYVFDVNAKSDDAKASATFRTTVRTQTGWGAAAIIIILAIICGVGAIFRKFGRH